MATHPHDSVSKHRLRDAPRVGHLLSWRWVHPRPDHRDLRPATEPEPVSEPVAVSVAVAVAVSVAVAVAVAVAVSVAVSVSVAVTESVTDNHRP